MKTIKVVIAGGLLTIAMGHQVLANDPIIPPPTDYTSDYFKSLANPPTGPTVERKRDPIVPPGCGMSCPSPLDNPAADLPERLPMPLPTPWIK
ncbi:hypothetical protein [Rhizobium leguminosarum]|uniref:hypothetical protein n=1 Tax=Rhizobium leguminosarum TaxID=384 RepID=UPI0010309ABF|nr:hypothetical protein [Rhizobium leguminosarum]TAX38966.1 hypothetical protein ELI05_08355 [Rhizobium leguminosarum]